MHPTAMEAKKQSERCRLTEPPAIHSTYLRQLIGTEARLADRGDW